MNKNILIILFSILLSVYSFCMGMVNDNSSLLDVIPDDCQKSILSHSTLQSLGRLTLVAKKYNQWINFEKDTIEGLGSLTDFLLQDFDRAHVALISAAHGDKKDFFYKFITKHNITELIERRNYVQFLQDVQPYDIDTYLNAYRGLCTTATPQQKLVDAVGKENNSNLARMILASDLYVNGCNSFGQAEDLLCSAVRNNNKKMVSLLLSNGAYLDVDCIPLLFIAATKGAVEMVQFLLDSGADINHKAFAGWTALHYAVSDDYKNEDVVKLLLDKGADVNQIDEECNTPLMVACKNGCQKAALMLLCAANSDPNLVNLQGQSALHCAAIAGRYNIVKLLCERAAVLEVDINHRDNDGNTALILACRHGQYDAAEELLKSGTGVNIRNNVGLSALHLAAENRRFMTIKLLLAYQAEINAKDLCGNTALHRVASEDRVVYNDKDWQVKYLPTQSEIIELLLLSGAIRNMQNNEGYSPFCCAIEAGNSDVIDHFLKKDPSYLNDCKCKQAITAIDFVVGLAKNNKLSHKQAQVMKQLIAYYQNKIKKEYEDKAEFEKKKLQEAHEDAMKKEKKQSSDKYRDRYNKDQNVRKKAFFISCSIALLNFGAYLFNNPFMTKMTLLFTSVIGINLMSIILSD